MLKNLFKLIFPDLCCGCKNLLLKNNYTISYPLLDKDGVIDFQGESFSMTSNYIGGDL
jgi:hypothetical protein